MIKNLEFAVASTQSTRTNTSSPHRQAVILAAGRGSRMNGESREIPKCLLEVGGRQLIEHQLDALAEHGIEDVCVVTGYRADLIERRLGRRATTIKNEIWDRTNSLFSLSLTRNWVVGDVVVINCDVLAHPDIFDRLLNNEKGSRFVYDSDSGDDDEHMKVTFAKDRTLTAMSKKMRSADVQGENVGMLYIAADDTEALFGHASDVLAAGGLHTWLASAVERLAASANVTGIDIRDLPWTEIDFPKDLQHARSSVWPKICEVGSANLLLCGSQVVYERTDLLAVSASSSNAACGRDDFSSE